MSSDEEYVASVEGSLSKSILSGFRLEFITDLGYLKKYFEVPHKIEVMIVEEKLMPEIPQNQSIGKVFIITEADRIGANLISKYLGAQGILMLLGPQFMTKEAGGEQIATRIHDVVALSDPEFKTVSALALCAQLANFGKKVLYLSADNMQNFNSILFSEKGDVELSNEEQALAMTAIINGDIRKLDVLIKKDKFDYVPEFSHFLSSYGITPTIIFTLAEAIRKLEIYDEIVIEHPFGFGEDSISRLEKSKSIVISTGQDRCSYDKLSRLFDNTREVAENSVLICYPYAQQAHDFISDFDKDRGIVCERIESGKLKAGLWELIDNKVFRSTAEAVL